MKKPLLLLFALPLYGATYYVDYTNGADSNNGTAKNTAWKYAPGMYSCASTCNSATLNAGDSVILRGCQTWHNEAFPWQTKFSGSAGNPITFGVDKTWYDTSVSGCASAWNRPILNPDATDFSHGSTYLERVVYLGAYAYQTFDNFEVTNVLCNDGYSNDEVTFFDFGDGTNGNNHVTNAYIHGWKNPYFSVGTGNVAANSSTITNFVPYSYSGSPAAGWASIHQPVLAQTFGYWPVQSNGPSVSSITGTNPYTIVTNSSTLSSACTGCVVQIGQDFCYIIAGVENADSGSSVENSVIDGSDTAEALLNPATSAGDCETNNQFCVSSAIAGWRLPNIWRNNVIRFIASGFVGECSEWSGNLMEYIRLSTNPTAHTNAIECLDETPVNGVTLSYNNVIRHTNVPNAGVPLGQTSIGLGSQTTPVSGSTAYIFNNVTYDTLQNGFWGMFTGGNGCCGSLTFFNNTGDGGPEWQLTNFMTQCPGGYTACLVQNNYLVSSYSTVVQSGCSGNCTEHTELVQTAATATSNGQTVAQTYAYSPTSGSLGSGTSISSICSAITSANAAAGAACLYDTTYGATYNTSTHTAVTGVRTALARTSGVNIGAYQYASGGGGSGSNLVLLGVGQ